MYVTATAFSPSSDYGDDGDDGEIGEEEGVRRWRRRWYK